MTAVKRCADCRQLLPVDLFAADPTRRDGWHPYDRACRNRRTKRNTLLRETGRSNLVDAGPARRHVSRCVVSGMTYTAVADQAGLNNTIVRNLLDGMQGRSPARRLRRATVAALLSVDPAPCAPGTVRSSDNRSGLQIDSTGTRRRVQALAAAGWPIRDLAVMLGRTGASLNLSIGRQRVSSNTALTVADLYDRLADRPGPSARTRTWARGRGWLTPAWWDVDTIDVPTVEPEGLREYDGQGRLTDDHTAWRADRVDRLRRAGVSPAQIADRLGVRLALVVRDLRGMKVETAA